jgi:phosphate transport system permease protein
MSTLATQITTAEVSEIRHRRIVDAVIEKVIYTSAFVSITIIFLIFLYVGKEALPVFTSAKVHEEVTLKMMFLPQHYGTAEAPVSYMWQPISQVPKYSLAPLLLGTFKVTLMAMLFATPLSVFAAIYTTEFAPRWLREIIKPAIELLAGIPSVVLGFFALIVLASWVQKIFDFEYRLNAVNAGIALGLAVIPVMYTIMEDALTAVPRKQRDAARALGATPWETAWKVVLPSALPGVLAGFILGFGRAMGETMIVLMASGNAAITSWTFAESVRTLSATIASELAEVVFGSPHYHVLFFVGTLLFAITFILNWLGTTIVGRLRRKLTGAIA